MEETAPEAPEVPHTEVWHVDFHMSFEPKAIAPNYLSAQVSRREPGTGEEPWHIEGIASFDCPPVVPPKLGADVIPYLLWHLEEIKQYLHEEHVRDVFTGVKRQFPACIAAPTADGRLHAV